MARPVFDLNDLRSLVAGVELGSLTRAADLLGRSTSAVSAHIKKLEDQAGTPLFRKVGRGLAPTDAGETLASYARRLISLNDDAAVAVRGTEIGGSVRVGIQEDGVEALLPAALGRFATAHPRVRIETVVARNADLMERLGRGALDLALAWSGAEPAPHAARLATCRIEWVGPAGAPGEIQAGGVPGGCTAAAGEAVPLVVLDGQCHFRATATAALDRARRGWALTVSSSSLTGVWAGVRAGLGITPRPALGLPAGLRILAGDGHSLPSLGDIDLVLYRRAVELEAPGERLCEIVAEEVAALTERSSLPT